MQQNTCGTVQYWRQTPFQILVNLPKWYAYIFLVKIWVGILITQTQKIDDCKQQPLMKIFTIRMKNHLFHPFPYLQPNIVTSIAYQQSLLMHHLQNTVSPTQYPNNNRRMLLCLARAGSNHGTQGWELGTLPNAFHQVVEMSCYRYLLICHSQHHLQ